MYKSIFKIKKNYSIDKNFDQLAFKKKKKKPSLDQMAAAPLATGGGALPLPEYPPHPGNQPHSQQPLN